MAFNDPSDSNFPEIEDGQYLMQLVRFEDAEPGQYGARMRWVFLLWNAATRQAVTWDNGDPFEWFQNTGVSTGSKSKARPWLKAFLNREITADDTGAGLAQEATGKYALAMIAENERGYSEIVSIKPYTKQAAAAPPPAEAPAPAQDPVAAGAGADPSPFSDVDPDDSPF